MITGMEPDRGVYMSLAEAKRVADLVESIEAESKLFAQKHDGFRKAINEEVLQEFRQKLEENDFRVSKQIDGDLVGVYKGIKVDLILAGDEDRYIGVYHSFNVVVNGVGWFVRVTPKFEGADDTAHQGTAQTADVLELKLASLRNNVLNLKLYSYTLGYQPENGKKSAAPIQANTIGDVLDAIIT